MAKIRFLSDNRFGAAATTVTASASAAGLPASNVKVPDRTLIWRSTTGTGTPTLDIDLGSVQALTAFAVANVKLVGAGVLELYHRGDSGSPGAATLIGTFATQDSDTRVSVVFVASTHRHFQVKWTNPGSANDYAELGYVFGGPYTEPSINVRVPMPVGRVDPSVVRPSVDGQQTAIQRTAYASGAWEFTLAPEADLTLLRALYRTVGIRTPFFTVLDEALTWTSWFLRLAGELRHGLDLVSGRYLISVPWEEAR